MNDEQIKQDRQQRVNKAKAEIEGILKKYEVGLEALYEAPGVKIALELRFIDFKKYESPIAQPENPSLVRFSNIKTAHKRRPL